MQSLALGLGGEVTLDDSSHVSDEFWVDSLERLVSLSLWLLDAIAVSLLVLVVSGMVL